MTRGALAPRGSHREPTATECFMVLTQAFLGQEYKVLATSGADFANAFISRSKHNVLQTA